MRINDFIPFTFKQIQRAYTYLEDLITRLFQQIFSRNQPISTSERLENVVTQIEGDSDVQRVAENALLQDESSEISTNLMAQG